MTIIVTCTHYNNKRNAFSDINEYLPTLYKYSTECESIIACGVRWYISSWAKDC